MQKVFIEFNCSPPFSALTAARSLADTMYSSVANTGTDGPLERASSADGNTNRPSSSGNAVGRSISSSGRPPRQPSKVSNGAYSELTPIHGTIPSSFEIDQPSLIHQPHAHWYHAAFHSICAVVGAGVLVLAFNYVLSTLFVEIGL